MKTITKVDFEAAAAKVKNYYKPFRWGYIQAAADIAAKYPDNTRVLELGAYHLPIVPGADLMDDVQRFENHIVHDANITPWPVKKGAYDLFIGLQVIEHLKNKGAAFKQIRRVAKNAIISLPYKWKTGDPTHDNIDEDVIYKWFRKKPRLKIICDRWIVLHYNF